jgi:hypothetical protein
MRLSVGGASLLESGRARYRYRAAPSSAPDACYGKYMRLASALRWPPVIVMIVSAAAIAALPRRYTIGDNETVQNLIVYGYIALVVLSAVAHQLPALRHVDRPAALGLIVVTSMTTTWYFGTIIGRIAFGGSNVKGGPLLEAAILVWIQTVLTFSLWYWFIDDGRDFMFPQLDSDRFAGWSPTYTDYVALAFNTATAFSPTDVLPASSRAKLMMMVQAGFSLATITIATARAVNVLA